MSRIWWYVLADDNGMAPCIDQGILTLSCCKPMIGRYAKEGEWVIAFVPKGLTQGPVAWVGRIAEILSLGDYQTRFSNRNDAIYKRIRYESDGRESLEPLRDDYHAKPRNRSSDIRGKKALIFEPFWYWGGHGISASEEITNLAYYHIGQTTKYSSPEKITQLKAWARSEANPVVHGKPRDELRTRAQKHCRSPDDADLPYRR